MSFAAGLLGAGLSAAGGLAGAGGALERGVAAQRAGNYNAMVALNNAVIANQEAERAIAAGQQKAAMTSLRSAANLGAIKAGQAAGGVDVNTGSAVDVQTSARELGKLATETEVSNAQNVAYGYRVQAASDVSQAQLDVMGGNEARAASREAAFGDILSSGGGMLSKASALGDKWKDFGKYIGFS